MADDWESAADEVFTAPPVVNQWAGEDEDDGAVPDSWDAEPEEKPKKEETVVEKKKAITKRALAKKEEEEKRLAEKQAAAQRDDPNFSAAERERLRRMEEDRDAALAGDLFGVEHVMSAKDASSDLPGSKDGAAAAAAAAALDPMAAVPAAASASSSSAAAAAPAVIPAALLKQGARIDELVLDTDADVQRFVLDMSKRLEKLGKSSLASKKVLSVITGIMEESVKVGVLRVDEVGELKRIATVRHNDMNAKAKKGDKKKTTAAAKPVVQLARNAFMHGDNFGSHADENGADYDFI